MEIGKINSIDINQEVRSSFLDYAMSVIVSRALPDARDGLKPVHRRILYAMYDMGIRANTPTRKSARIVGEVLGKYHPHGDSSVYDAMVRMAQDFSMRYMLVEGQGNFGSVDGDSAAAMRYTEARLSPIAMQLLEDIDKNTVDFDDNFDGSLQEPTLLPARLPNLLLNGGSGIAVGMATNIPPHNLGELCDAITYLIDRQDEQDNVSLEDLMEFVKGPDFPTGATIMGMEGIKAAYGTGKGRIVLRAVAEIGDSPARSDRSRITVTELPYQVNKANLIERIAELVNQGKLSDIADLRDESDQRGVSIVIELKRGTQPRKVLNQLYKHTFLQTTFAVQMLALVDKEPRLLSLKRALQIHIDHRLEVITRRIQFELDKALKRQHILEGLMIALNHLDEVIETIRRSDDAESARGQLIERFGLSEAQATAILDMQLRRLAALERQKIEAEYAEITAHIAHLRHLLSDKKEILAIIREDVAALKKDFGDARRTKIEAADGELRDEDLVRDENILISITRRGYIKRTPVNAYRKQGRGGRGLIGMGTRDEDELEHLFAAGSLNTILLFSDSGKVYAVKAYEIPELDRTAKGTSLMNIVPLQSDEKITAALPVRSFEDAQYLTMITRRGRIKRVAVNEFRNVRSNGLIAVNLDDKDALGWVKLTQGEQDMILVSQHGHGIRFREEDVRAMGRTAIGVYAMRLADGDELAGADVVIPDGDLLLITEKGVGKRTPLDEYRQQGRYGKGVQVMKLDPKRSGNIVSARVVTRDDEMTCISSNGLILRTAVHNISRQGRYSQGVSVMDLKADDSVVSVAVIREGYLSQANGEEPEIAEEETAVAADSETVDTVPVE